MPLIPYPVNYYNYSMAIPLFPNFAPISLEHKNELHPKLSLTIDGVSEFTFAGLYLFRKRYQYQVSRVDDRLIIISGIQPPPASSPSTQSPPNQLSDDNSSAANEIQKNFFMTPCACPQREILDELFKTHDFWKNIPESILERQRAQLEEWGFCFTEDRDNFDYLYQRKDLAELAGKKYHKKRNLIAQFLKFYIHEERPLCSETIPDAMKVLESWHADRGERGDYTACREALELFSELNHKGLVLYIDGKPGGLCMGEPAARGRIFTIHFEKGLDRYKGIYQFINQAFAITLPRYFTLINREQDLGDEGLR